MPVDTKQGLEAALADVNDQIRRIQSQITSTENSRNFTAAEKAPRLADLRAELAVLKGQQSRLIAALNQLDLNNQRNTSSSADIVANAQVAKDDNAYPGAPSPPIPTEIAADGRITKRGIVSDSNANRTATTENGAADIGTNDETRKLSVTQSISSPPPVGPLKEVPVKTVVSAQSQEAGVYASNSGGASGIGAQNEDRSAKPSNSTQNLLDNLYGSNTIKPNDNVLDQYSSYTYNLSWYLLSPSSYANILSGTDRGLTDYYLLAQSGGAPVQNAVPTQSGIAGGGGAGTVGVGRNPYFPLDYYIDDFFVDYLYAGTPGAGGASQVSELGFTVSEPNGITLLTNLYSAITDVYQAQGITSSTDVNYSAAQYCMIVRFYGYDANGNLMLPITGKSSAYSDSYAVVQKVIPFVISSIDFKVANKLVEYTIKAVPPGQATGLSTNRASMPNNFTFKGATVKEMLVGGIQQQLVVALDDKRSGGDGTWSV